MGTGDGKTPERFADVPEPVREFLATLRPEEITLLMQSIKFMSAASTIGRFAAWVIGGVVAALIGAWGAIEAVVKIIASIKGAK